MAVYLLRDVHATLHAVGGSATWILVGLLSTLCWIRAGRWIVSEGTRRRDEERNGARRKGDRVFQHAVMLSTAKTV